MDSKRGVLAGIVATGWLLSMMSAHATCVSPGFNPSGVFCNGCRYEGHMTMARNETCERAYRQPLAIRSNRVIERAKHGIGGANGNTFAYAPAKGYVGPDDFAIEVDYGQGKEAGRFTVHWNIMVQ